MALATVGAPTTHTAAAASRRTAPRESTRGRSSSARAALRLRRNEMHRISEDVRLPAGEVCMRGAAHTTAGKLPGRAMNETDSKTQHVIQKNKKNFHWNARKDRNISFGGGPPLHRLPWPLALLSRSLVRRPSLSLLRRPPGARPLSAHLALRRPPLWDGSQEPRGGGGGLGGRGGGAGSRRGSAAGRGSRAQARGGASKGAREGKTCGCQSDRGLLSATSATASCTGSVSTASRGRRVGWARRLRVRGTGRCARKGGSGRAGGAVGKCVAGRRRAHTY